LVYKIYCQTTFKSVIPKVFSGQTPRDKQMTDNAQWDKEDGEKFGLEMLNRPDKLQINGLDRITQAIRREVS
jgi:hypothetical protein